MTIELPFRRVLPALLAAAALAVPARAQDKPAPVPFSKATEDLQQQVATSIAELERIRQAVTDEKLPMNRALGDREAELLAARAELQKQTRALDGSALDLSTLRNDIKQLEEEGIYLANLFGEYIRNSESRLHIAEQKTFGRLLQESRLAAENQNLAPADVYGRQVGLLTKSLDRLYDLLGGTTFAGSAIDPAGTLRQGRFVLLGPLAVFRSDDGAQVGTVEERIDSSEPAVVAFARPEHTEAAAQLVASGSGVMPVDPTLGNALKVEATEETLVEHILKGGPVMAPILLMGALALLVVLWKWLSLSRVRVPGRRRMTALLEAVGRMDRDAAKREAAAMRGPVGRMLADGVAHLDDGRELVEEVMYESMLASRLKLQRMLPFVAICAASAPLLGLLGTVTGIIKTFTMITLFGSSDVGQLSSGISEALITTEYGLIVAIPSLILHAWLSRKAKAIGGAMEQAALAVVNRMKQLPIATPELIGETGAAADAGHVRAQVTTILRELLIPLSGPEPVNGAAGARPR